MHLDWEEGRTRRKRAVNEVLRLLNTLEWSPVSEPSPGHTLPTHTHTISPEEQGMIDVIAAELSNVQNVLAPAVATFPRSFALQTAQKERKYLSRLLFETVERLDATRINLDWEQARKERRGAVKTVEKLQNELDGLPTCTEEQNVISVIASERSKTQFLLLPAVTAYLGNPTERERLRLSELLSQALERLDGVTLESAWDQARTERKEAISEMQRLLDRLIIEPRAKTQEEQHALHLVTAELSRIQFLFTQAVNFFLEKPNEKERARLSELFMQTLERLDSIPVQQEWEEVLQVRRNAVHELQNLQSICDHPPSSTEIYTEHSAIAAIACERSKIQTELAPAILNFVRASQPSTLATGTVAQASLNEKERLRLSELSLRLLERLDAVAIESAWDEARKERKSAVGEVQKLQDMLDVWGP
ncbi:hypothetical protein B0H11DRAFT_885830 [Mycena galericulata]|nr:hypothetical protein B0H11DRAFT_885830 [Mycena galericulata]